MNNQVQMISKNKLKLFIAVLVLGVMIMAPGSKVSADSHESQNSGDYTGVPDSQQHSDERQIQGDVNTNDGSAQFQSENKNGNQHNSFQFELQTHEQVTFSFSYKSQTSNSHYEVEMKFELRRLVEFVDNTSNPNNFVNGLDNKDTIVQQIDFETLSWAISHSSNTVGNQTVYTINVNATKGSMVISLSFFISTGYVNQTNHILTPNSVKFNVEIKNFPYQQSNSLLAAQVQIKNSLHNRQIENETENHKDGFAGKEQQVSFDNNSAGAFFSWATTYLADNANKTIVVSPVTNDNEGEGTQAKIYFNFAHANDIFWDPSVGVTRSSMTTSATPGFEVIGFIALPAVILISRKFKMNRKS